MSRRNKNDGAIGIFLLPLVLIFGIKNCISDKINHSNENKTIQSITTDNNLTCEKCDIYLGRFDKCSSLKEKIKRCTHDCDEHRDNYKDKCSNEILASFNKIKINDCLKLFKQSNKKEEATCSPYRFELSSLEKYRDTTF